MEKRHLLGDGRVVFSFQGFQEQRELGGLHGLAVDVHAKDVSCQDALAFGDGEADFALGVLIDGIGNLIGRIGLIPF